MGKAIIRSSAIKLLWLKAKEVGLNKDQIEEFVHLWHTQGWISHNRISALENKELANFMNTILNTNVFITDDKITRYIKSLIKNKELKDKVDGIIRNYKLQSLYQFKPHQKRFLVGYLLKNQ
jgi:uncharacterized membrane protein